MEKITVNTDLGITTIVEFEGKSIFAILKESKEKKIEFRWQLLSCD